LNILKDFKVLSRFMQICIQPPACSDHGLHRILSSYWLAHFYLMKKSAKVLLYLGLGCGMMEFFTYEPKSKEQLISLPHFWSTEIFAIEDAPLVSTTPVANNGNNIRLLT
jgi:hypothetical protein